MVNLQINEKDRIQMRQQSKQLLPGNPDSVEGQQAVLKMIEAVLPAAEICSRNADASLWPRVQRREMSMRDARRKCGNYLNKLAGITIVENLKLEEKSVTAIQRAWIAMETFGQVMSPEENQKLRSLQDRLLAALLQRESQPTVSRNAVRPASVVDVKTVEAVPVVPPVPVAPVQEIRKPEPISTLETTGEGKKKNPATAIVAIVLVLALAVVGGFFGWQNMQVSEVERSIDAIGTVTMESSGVIKSAELAYSELSESLQGKVDNYETLTAARTEYDRLTKLVQDAVDAINGIGTVSLDSGSKIQKARKAYDALADEGLTGYVTEEAAILTAAEKKYGDLRVEDLLTTAEKLLAEKNYEEALNNYQELLKEFPSSSRVGEAKTGAGACMVMLAQKAFDAGEYKKTMTLLTDARKNYGDSTENQTLLEKLNKKLTTIRPINKKIIEDNVAWGYGKLEVTAGSQDACIKVVTLDENNKEVPEKAVLFYVRAGETAEIDLDDGSYKILYTSGDKWFDALGSKPLKDWLAAPNGFGDDAVYKEISKKYTYKHWQEGLKVYYYKFSLSLAEVESGNVSARDITADDFWH